MEFVPITGRTRADWEARYQEQRLSPYAVPQPQPHEREHVFYDPRTQITYRVNVLALEQGHLVYVAVVDGYEYVAADDPHVRGGLGVSQAYRQVVGPYLRTCEAPLMVPWSYPHMARRLQGGWEYHDDWTSSVHYWNWCGQAELVSFVALPNVRPGDPEHGAWSNGDASLTTIAHARDGEWEFVATDGLPGPYFHKVEFTLGTRGPLVVRDYIVYGARRRRGLLGRLTRECDHFVVWGPDLLGPFPHVGSITSGAPGQISFSVDYRKPKQRWARDEHGRVHQVPHTRAA